MIADLNWTLTGNREQGEALIHYAECAQQQHDELTGAVNAGMDRAIAIIAQSIRDDARYLLCMWDGASGTLDIVTTDDNKQLDAPESVRLQFTHWGTNADIDRSEQEHDLHFWIHDYLTTSGEFLHFSLIALFSSDQRQHTRLL